MADRPPANALRSPDGTQWWDGTSWQPLPPSPPTIPADAVRSPDGAYWWDGNAWQPVSAIDYPVVVHGQYAELTATAENVVYTWARDGAYDHKEFQYSALKSVSIDQRPTGHVHGFNITLHGYIAIDERLVQRCPNVQEVLAFVEAMRANTVQLDFDTTRYDEPTLAVSPPTVIQPRPRRPQVKVKSYRDEHEYQRDAQKMLRGGWHIEGQSDKDRKIAIGRTAVKGLLTGAIGLVLMGRSKKGDTITVTWVR